MTTVFIYVNTSKRFGDPEHLKVFANVDAAENWFEVLTAASPFLVDREDVGPTKNWILTSLNSNKKLDFDELEF